MRIPPRYLGGYNKKTFTPVKTANEGIQRIPAKTVRRAGLILLLTEKLAIDATVIDRRYNDQTSTTKPVS